jgi:hypothetical protein
MRSLQVAYVYADQFEELGRFTELQVLKSAAGWYIGTLYNAVEGWQEPGSRDSDYYPTEERANYALTYLNNLYGLLRHETTAEEIVDRWAKHMHTMGYDPRQVGYRFTP